MAAGSCYIFAVRRYLTRLHYCAADTASGPPGAQWGEHEVDYILFARADVDLQPNPEEVADTRHVTEAELRAMMAPDSGLAWSPWFRIIARNFLSRRASTIMCCQAHHGLPGRDAALPLLGECAPMTHVCF